MHRDSTILVLAIVAIAITATGFSALASSGKAAPEWVSIPGNQGELREYDRTRVLVRRVSPGAIDIDGDPIVDSIQIVFRDGSSLNLYCSTSRYQMWDTVARKNWGGQVNSMPLATLLAEQYCPIMNQLKCKPTFNGSDPPCDNKDY